MTRPCRCVPPVPATHDVRSASSLAPCSPQVMLELKQGSPNMEGLEGYSGPSNPLLAILDAELGAGGSG